MINCSCGDESYESPTVCWETFPVAAKQHVCCECRCVIPVGTQYHHVAGIYDAVFEKYHTCLACYRIREDFCSNGYVFGELRESLIECLNLDYLEGRGDD
jgi:hypothetical protein